MAKGEAETVEFWISKYSGVQLKNIIKKLRLRLPNSKKEVCARALIDLRDYFIFREVIVLNQEIIDNIDSLLIENWEPDAQLLSEFVNDSNPIEEDGSDVSESRDCDSENPQRRALNFSVQEANDGNVEPEDENPDPPDIQEPPKTFTEGERRNCLLQQLVKVWFMNPISGYKDDSPLKMGSANEKVVSKNLNGFFERCNVHVRVGAGREFGLVCSRKDEFLAVSPDWVVPVYTDGLLDFSLCAVEIKTSAVRTNRRKSHHGEQEVWAILHL